MRLTATIIVLFFFSGAIAQSKRDTIAANIAGKKGNTLYGLGKFDSAIYYYKEAAMLDQDKGIISGFSYAYIGQIDKQQGKIAEAIASLNKAIALHTDKGSVDYAQSALIWISFEDKNFADVKESSHKMIQNRTTYADPYIALGSMYEQQAVNDSALYYLIEGLKLDNDKTWKSTLGYISLGKVYISLGKKDKAIEELKKAVAMKTPENLVHTAQKMLDDMDKKVAKSPKKS